MSTLKNNAYHILGLDTLASEKEILKRSKEIINRIKSGDCPEYDLDIALFNDFRTEESVRNAQQKLLAPKKRIIDYFFWYQISDSIDEQVIRLFKLKDYLNAIRIWQGSSEGETTKAFFYKKNLAVLYCLVLSAENDHVYLRDSIKVWKELIDSDKFWISFAKIYKLHDEQTASEDTISDFKTHVIEHLSDIYTELYQIHDDTVYISEFQEAFSMRGDKMEKSVLSPAYQKISKAIEELENIEVSKGGGFGKEKSETIKTLVFIVQQELNQLIDIGLYNDSQTKIMRDRAANSLRTIVLDIHNNLDELEKSKGLLRIAIQICGTESLKNKLENELEQIQKNISDDVDNTVRIELPGKHKGSSIVFKNNFLDYDNKKVFYRDVTAISYHSISNSTTFYGIPLSKSYTYNLSIHTGDTPILLSFFSYSDKNEKSDTWVRLVGMIGYLIAPLIVKDFIERIFVGGEAISIGGVEFTKDGYSRNVSKFIFWQEKKIVLWSETIYVPKFDSGSVILWRDENDKCRQFGSVFMSTRNAVIIPELVKACVNQPH